MPGVLECVRDDLPLAALLGEGVSARRSDAVVSTLPATLRGIPPRLDVAEPVEPVKQGIQHPVGPLHLSAGQLVDPLQDGVSVTLALVEDGEDKGYSRSSNEVFPNPDISLGLHRGIIHRTTMYRIGQYTSE